MRKDTLEYYGTISRLFHWLTVLGYAFIVYTIIAWKMDEDNLGLISVHQSVGFLLFVLTILRIIWVIVQRKTRPRNSKLAHIGHGVIYLLILLIPLLGILRQYGGARKNLEVFGITVLPTASNKIEFLTQLGNTLHGKLGMLLFLLIIGHIVMAIVHQIRGEKILNRMLGK
ncbi:MAG: cytochrome b/b6 domain-containing protein [Neisseriaceae bacterium]|nr:cytochrome b/b6 domain-containing protein [Neisseriaceae bacterium]